MNSKSHRPLYPFLGILLFCIFLLTIQGCVSEEGLPSAESIVFVSFSGSENSNGLDPEFPLVSIQAAVELAVKENISKIFLEAGEYTRGSGLNVTDAGLVIDKIGITRAKDRAFSLQISGGWNSGFTEQVGYSILDAGGIEEGRVMEISNSRDLIIEGLIFKRGIISKVPTGIYRIAEYAGGGVRITTSTKVQMSNCIIESNVAYHGGGMYIGEVLINPIVTSGPAFLGDSKRHVIECEIKENTASELGGGLYLSNSSLNKVNAELHDNSAKNGGGVYSTMDDCEYQGKIYNNTAFENGGGLYLKNSKDNMIISKIDGNMASDSGGGVYLQTIESATIKGNIENNTAVIDGGGLFSTGFNGNILIESSFANNSPNNMNSP